jgi:hypothetical protein
MRRVVILGFPLAEVDRARQHNEALMREFAFIAEETGDPTGVPSRLIALVEALHDRYAGLNTATEEMIEAAIARGDREMDVELEVPPDAKDSALALGAMLDEADEFCRSGALLTLSTPDDVRDLRAWYLEQFVDQLEGKPATSWPEWKRNRATARS